MGEAAAVAILEEERRRICLLTRLWILLIAAGCYAISVVMLWNENRMDLALRQAPLATRDS